MLNGPKWYLVSDTEVRYSLSMTLRYIKKLPFNYFKEFRTSKTLGRLRLAFTEIQGDFTCYNSHLLTLGTLHSQNSAYGGPIYKYHIRMWACSDTSSY